MTFRERATQRRCGEDQSTGFLSMASMQETAENLCVRGRKVKAILKLYVD
jgi:hypothetical protein